MNFNHRLILAALVCVGLAGAGASVQAQPALNAECAKSIKIRAPKGGAGVYFDKDCEQAYVLPPSIGQISLEGISMTSNLRACAPLEGMLKAFSAKSDKLLRLLNKDGEGSPAKGSSGGLFRPKPSEPGGSEDQALSEYEKLMKSFVDSMATLKDSWTLHGATAQMTYQVHHQALVEEYQKLNPHITFRPITLHDSRIYMARKVGSGESTTSLPAVLYSNIPGFSGIQSQEGELGSDSGIQSGEAQSAQVEFSLTGACPYYDSQRNRFPVELSAKDLAAHVTANIRYVYELEVHRGYTAKYNLGAFMRRLQTSTKKGGFFSSKTINKLIVEENTKDWFEIEMHSEDGRSEYDPEFAQTVKAQMIERALSNISLLVTGQPIAAPQSTNPQANGAEVGARELRKCPHIYCQAGAAALDVANAIFGSSQSVADYIRTHDTWVTETEKDRRMFPFHGTVTFTAKGR